MKILNQEAKFVVTLEFGSADEFKQFSKVLKGMATHQDGVSRGYKRRSDFGTKKPKGSPWTEQETNFLKENYLRLPLRELAVSLPGRTVATIYAKAAVLGLKKGHKNPVKSEHETEIQDEQNASSQLEEKPSFPKFKI